MSRQVRISRANSWYYIRNYVRTDGTLLKDENDSDSYIALLNDVIEMHQIAVAAVHIDKKQVHMLCYLPNNDLSTMMRHINGVYTQRYNRKYGGDGSLFKGRYQASIVQTNIGLLWISAHIHSFQGNNSLPFCSSLSAYTNNKQSKDLAIPCNTNPLLSLLARYFPGMNYAKLLKKPIPSTYQNIFARKTLPSFIGDLDFCGDIESTESCISNSQKPLHKAISPQFIVRTIAEFFALKKSDICVSRPSNSRARNFAMLLTKQYSPLNLNQIADLFGLGHYASVSNRLTHTKKLLNNCQDSQKLFEHLTQHLFEKHQELTMRQ